VKPIRIVTEDDVRIIIPFEIPLKGRKPLLFKVPRLDFLTEDEFDSMTKEIEALDEEKTLNTMHKKTRAVVLVMLRPFVTKPQLTALERVPISYLNQILEAWQENSATSLGEFLASANSSTENTGAPSDTTSSPGDGQEPTLAAV